MRMLSVEALVTTLAALPVEQPRVVTSGNAATHLPALTLISSCWESWRLFVLNAPLGIPTRDGIVLETPFLGPGQRDQPGLTYLPTRLSLVPGLFRTTRPPDVVLLHTSLPHEGTLSLGVEVNILPAAVEAARDRGALVIAVLNPHMPYTYGDGVIPVEDVDLALEIPYELPAPPPRRHDATSDTIGERIAALVPTGATIQLGIGAVPDAALRALRSHRGLRIFSEMFSDGVLGLSRSGSLAPGEPVVASFVAGSAELIAWVRRNPLVRLLRTEKTNDPGVIARQPRMTSVNAAMQVDLYAQANASRRPGGGIFSGFGGSTDFIVGALHSVGGQAVIALPSWHAKADVSTVVELVDGPVTSFQHSAFVTDQGTAALHGRSQDDQAAAIIGQAAHPDARPALIDAARSRGLRVSGSSVGR